MTHYYDLIDSPFGPMLAVVDAAGALTQLHFNPTPATYSRLGDAEADAAKLAEVRRQLGEYLAGTRTAFELALAPVGSAFQQQVWQRLLAIPYGETRSYGELARELGDPNLSRAVGRANGSNPIALIVPCHRVIGADGSLTGYAGGLPLKQALLAFERKHSPLRQGELFS